MPADELVNKELNKVLEAAITTFPGKYGLVFTIRYIKNISVREAPIVLNIEDFNVTTSLNRAKTILHEKQNGYLKDKVYNFRLGRCERIGTNVIQRLDIFNVYLNDTCE